MHDYCIWPYAGVVCLQCKNCVSASGVRFSRWGAIQIFVPLPLLGLFQLTFNRHQHIRCYDLMALLNMIMIVIIIVVVVRNGVVIRPLFLARRHRWACCHISARRRPMFHVSWLAPRRSQLQRHRRQSHAVCPTMHHTGLAAVESSSEQLGGDVVARLCVLEVRRSLYESSCDARLRDDCQDHVPQR